MKTYIEIEKKKDEYNKKYDKLKEENSKDEDTLLIYSDWIDLLDEFLIWNITDYAKKIGFDLSIEHDEIFPFTDEAKKEMLISENEAQERLCVLEKEISNNKKMSKKLLNLLKNEADILRWILEDK